MRGAACCDIQHAAPLLAGTRCNATHTAGLHRPHLHMDDVVGIQQGFDGVEVASLRGIGEAVDLPEEHSALHIAWAVCRTGHRGTRTITFCSLALTVWATSRGSSPRVLRHSSPSLAALCLTRNTIASRFWKRHAKCSPVSPS